ncbi:hypothetical protein U9M48_007763 [Paspalum notatum var. saurae]|uniref:Transmembrane protein 135 N-terminal domain-containing protein n=1 Tax=Paspalum notatum var. saurae TaxID=547442 RepID=A0AAQ3WCC7_PASNO
MPPCLPEEEELILPPAPSPRPPVLPAAWESYPRWLRRCVEAVLKGFAIGSGLKGGLTLFSALLRLRGLVSRGARKSSAAAATNGAEAPVVRAVKETVRYGVFLGTFAGTYVSMDECIAAVWGRERTARWRSLFAGLIAGPTMLFTGLRTTHTSLATYILVRAGVLAARCGMKSERFGKICRPLAWPHGDIFMMCVSSAQIAQVPSQFDNDFEESAYILNRDSFPPSYKAFLGRQIGKDPVVLQGLKELVNNSAFTNLAGIEKYYKTVGIDLKLDPEMKIPCSILHGNQSCTGHFFSFLLQAYGRAFPVYVPVYLIPALVVHRTHLIKRPLSAIGKNLLGIARSSLFLSVYCACEWGWTCLLFRTFQRCNIPLLVLGTFPTGLALLIEKKSRRIEISLYCLARALESFCTCMADAGLLPSVSQIKRADVVVFSIATSIIMHCYAQEREVFRSKYLNVLDWVFGVPTPSTDENKQNDLHDDGSLERKNVE